MTRRSTTARIFCRPRSISSSSAARSGTIRFAASVGVEARKSATKSNRGASSSWPTAETSGVRAAKAARTTDSSEKPSKSSKAPPPRVTTKTSTSGRASSSAMAAETSAAQLTPCTATSRTSKTARGQRLVAFSITSALARAPCPQIKPMRRGKKGRGFLCSAANKPWAASFWRSSSSCSNNPPRPTTGTMREASKAKEPVLV